MEENLVIQKLNEEIKILQNKIDGIRFAISIIRDQNIYEHVNDKVIFERGGIKKFVLSCLQECGDRGVTAKDIVGRNNNLNRQTVSSLLSRYKREGIVKYNGSKYYICE